MSLGMRAAFSIVAFIFLTNCALVREVVDLLLATVSPVAVESVRLGLVSYSVVRVRRSRLRLTWSQPAGSVVLLLSCSISSSVPCTVIDVLPPCVPNMGAASEAGVVSMSTAAAAAGSSGAMLRAAAAAGAGRSVPEASLVRLSG